jgi:hypothetical protein
MSVGASPGPVIDASVTASPQLACGASELSPSIRVRWAINGSGAAPCQCFSPGAVQMVSPGCTWIYRAVAAAEQGGSVEDVQRLAEPVGMPARAGARREPDDGQPAATTTCSRRLPAPARHLRHPQTGTKRVATDLNRHERKLTLPLPRGPVTPEPAASAAELAGSCCRRTGQPDHRDRPAIVGLPATSSRDSWIDAAQLPISRAVVAA